MNNPPVVLGSLVLNVWSDSTYPQHEIARCEVLERSQDSLGRKLARVTIAKPDRRESVSGLSSFVVLASQVSEDFRSDSLSAANG